MKPYVALDEMTQMFRAAYPYPVELPNKPLERDASVTHFATLAFEHFDMAQSALVNAESKRKYTNVGQCTIELFFPPGIGLQEPYAVAETVREAFKGKHSPSDVWFRDVRLVEHNTRTGNPPRIPGTFQIDVLFSFTYDDVS